MINTKFLSDRTRVHIWGRLQSLISCEADYKIGSIFFMEDAHKTFGVDRFWALFVGGSTWRLFLTSQKKEMEAYMVLSDIQPNVVLIESSRLELYPEGYSARELLKSGFASFVKGKL